MRHTSGTTPHPASGPWPGRWPVANGRWPVANAVRWPLISSSYSFFRLLLLRALALIPRPAPLLLRPLWPHSASSDFRANVEERSLQPGCHGTTPRLFDRSLRRSHFRPSTPPLSGQCPDRAVFCLEIGTWSPYPSTPSSTTAPHSTKPRRASTALAETPQDSSREEGTPWGPMQPS